MRRLVWTIWWVQCSCKAPYKGGGKEHQSKTEVRERCEDVTLLAEKTEEGAASQGMQMGFWKLERAKEQILP